MHLLLVEDDEVFAQVTARVLTQRGYEVSINQSYESACAAIANGKFQYAILDLNLGSENSLALIPLLRQQNKNMRILILTGYASIATAVESIKLGADNYLSKPADIDEILAALLPQSLAKSDAINAAQALEPMSVRRLEWEHIQKILKENDGNISATARHLKMHRRTLQRKLQKRPVSK